MERRNDGFHDLETLFLPAYGLCDILEIVESDVLSMKTYGISYDGDPMDDLCVKAYRAVERRRSLPPVEICLHKMIPVGAGLGGGSSDASFVIRGLNEMFGLKLSVEEMIEAAAEVGSDCPFFILNEPAYAEGRGEKLELFSGESVRSLAEDYEIRFRFPGLHISTKEAYGGITPRKKKGGVFPDDDLKAVLNGPVASWKGVLVNDFEEVAFRMYPEIAQIKEDFYRQGAVYASMTGSGSAVFGIFKK